MCTVTSPTGSDGTTVVNQVIRPGQQIKLPDGDTLQLDSVEYYARLAVVDDWSIPLLYLGLIVAFIGLGITVIARQQMILATVIDGPDGPRLVARVRLWRNASSSRSEIETELTRALREKDKGSTS